MLCRHDYFNGQGNMYLIREIVNPLNISNKWRHLRQGRHRWKQSMHMSWLAKSSAALLRPQYDGPSEIFARSHMYVYYVRNGLPITCITDGWHSVDTESPFKNLSMTQCLVTIPLPNTIMMNRLREGRWQNYNTFLHSGAIRLRNHDSMLPVISFILIIVFWISL